MLAIGKHLVLVRQVRAARIDEIDGRQPVLRRDFLRAQVLFHRHRVVGAALDRGVVRHDHAFASRDAADAGDDPARGRVVAVHAVGGELADLEEGRARVEQRPHALARQELAARDVLRACGVVAAERGLRDLLAQIGDQALHAREVRAVLLRAGVECWSG